MRVVTGKTSEEMAAAEFGRRAAAYDTHWLDIGAGDGALPYRLAGQFPDVLCLGLDPNAEAMAANAHRARRKPERGGRANCLYVVAAVEAPPPELTGLAGAITINFPWARLLEIVLGARDDGSGPLATAVAALAAPDCSLQLLVNEVTDLPAVPTVDPVMLAERLTPALLATGFGIDAAEWLRTDARVRSRWGGRLIRGSGRRVVRLRASRGAPGDRVRAILDAIAPEARNPGAT